jgi:hypothetical protein
MRGLGYAYNSWNATGWRWRSFELANTDSGRGGMERGRVSKRHERRRRHVAHIQRLWSGRQGRLWNTQGWHGSELEAQTRRCSAGSEDATTCAGDSGASYWSPSIESSMVRQSRATHTLPPQHEVSRGSPRCAQRALVRERAQFRKRPLPSC